jgi:hypothetical protein
VTAATLDTTARQPRTATVVGWALSGLVIAFLVFDAAMKVVQHPIVLEATAELGYSRDIVAGLGITILAIAVLSAIPRTAALGVLLQTALYGGTFATHLRLESPLFSHTLFGVYLAAMAWGGLWLRDERVRALLPFRR